MRYWIGTWGVKEGFLGEMSFALRLMSDLGRQEGWERLADKAQGMQEAQR